MYRYYKGSDDYPDAKSKFFGFYERCFELTYKGKPEDKEESFKDYMSSLLYEQASDSFMFGVDGVDNSECYRKYLNEYFNHGVNKEVYEPKTILTDR
ncbi:MAG: hypothetical protein RR048_00550 [Oscillospiraceae bacterium]